MKCGLDDYTKVFTENYSEICRHKPTFLMIYYSSFSNDYSNDTNLRVNKVFICV